MKALSSYRPALAFIACAALLTFLAFGRAIEAPFFWDDKALILGNRYLGSLTGLLKFFSPAFWQEILCPEDYRPMEMWSYSLDYYFWRENPLGYRLTNLLLHLFCCAAVYLFTRSVTRSRFVAVAAGALFAVHPIHGEAIIWIQNRSELLSAALSLVCVIAFFRCTHGGERARIWLILAAFSLALAALAKESALAVPFLCALYVFGQAKPARGSSLRRLAILLAIGCALFFAKFVLLKQGRFSQAYPLIEGGVFSYLFTVSKTIATYLVMLALPVNFSIARQFSIPIGAAAPAPLLSAAALLLLAVWTLRALMRGSPAGFAVAFLLIALIPVSNIVYFASRPIAEQRLYLPSAGFCMLIAIGIEKALAGSGHDRAVLALILALPTACILIAAERSEYWRDEQTLWERTLELSPRAVRPKLYLARLYRRQGRHDDAVELLKRGIRNSSPPSAALLVELGHVYDAFGRAADALRCYRRAADLEPDDFHSRLALAGGLRSSGRHAEALEQYALVEKRWPFTGKGQLGASVTYREMGDPEAALKKAEEALAIRPDDVRVLSCAALAHAAAERPEDAERLFLRALEVDPGSAMVRNDYGLYLERLGRTDEAIEQYAKASEEDPGAWQPLINLARAYRSSGRKIEALIAFMRAAQAKPGRDDTLAEINRLSDELARTGIPAEALPLLMKEHCALLNRRAIHCARIGEEEEAIDCLLKLITLQPGNGDAHANLGRIRARRGEHSRAIEDLRRAAALLPGEAAIYSSLGSCYAALGRYGEARSAWRRALELDPRAKEPRRNLARLRSGN